MFYTLLTGASPSVVRACIMVVFVLAAPLFQRDSDPPTTLSAALFLILLANPFAAASISLQLSFGAMAGLLWLTPKLQDLLLGERPSGKVCRLLVSSLSATVGAMAFTVPFVRCLLRVAGTDLSGKQPAVPDSLQPCVHAGAWGSPGELPLGTPGDGDRFRAGFADPVYPLDIRGSGVCPPPRPVLHQPVPEILAGISVCPLRRGLFSAAQGPAEVCRGGCAGGGIPGGDGAAGRAPLHPGRPGRLCAGRGAGGERAADLRREICPGGLRQPQQLVRRRRHRGGSPGHHGLRDAGLSDSDPL